MNNLLILISIAILVELLAAVFIAARTAISRTSESRVEQIIKDSQKNLDKLLKVIQDKSKHIASLQLFALALTSTGGVLITFVIFQSYSENNFSIFLSVVIVSLLGFIVLGVAPETLGRQKSDAIAIFSAQIGRAHV